MSHKKEELTMKRNAFLITAVLFCFANFATAGEQKKDSPPQSKQGEQVEKARNDAGASRVYASAKSECVPNPTSELKLKNTQGDLEGDPQASQNEVEYGGGG
jgi:hypothetical protein